MTLKQQRSKLLVWREQEREDVVFGQRDVFVAPNEHAVRIVAQCGTHLGDPQGRWRFVVLQDVENISELADEGLQLIGGCELELLKPQLGGALEIPDRFDEELGDIVERLLALRENEQPRERISLGRLQHTHLVDVQRTRLGNELHPLGDRQHVRRRRQAVRERVHRPDMLQETRDLPRARAFDATSDVGDAFASAFFHSAFRCTQRRASSIGRV
jgi:hypothetical protein